MLFSHEPHAESCLSGPLAVRPHSQAEKIDVVSLCGFEAGLSWSLSLSWF